MGQPGHNTAWAKFHIIWIEIFSTSKILLPPSAPSGEKELEFQKYSNLFVRNFYFKLHIWLLQRTSCALVFTKTCKKQLKKYLALTFFPMGGRWGQRDSQTTGQCSVKDVKIVLGCILSRLNLIRPDYIASFGRCRKVTSSSNLFFFFLILPGKGQGIRDRVLV